MKREADLRWKILDESIQLFKTRGVKATTIKSIASAVGCTNAALYYCFEGGKTEILEEALRGVLSEGIRTFERLNTALPFQDFLRQIGVVAATGFGSVTDNISWLLVEFVNLPDDLQTEFHEHLKTGHAVLVAAFQSYLDDVDEASALAWTLFCTFVGYQQVFGKLGLAGKTDFNPEDLMESVVRAFSSHQQPRGA